MHYQWLFLMCINIALGDFSSAAYQQNSRADKLDLIINTQFQNVESATFLPTDEDDLQTYGYSVEPIFNQQVDELPLYSPEGVGDAYKPVPKPQAQGIITSVTWVSTKNHPYTGMFAEGCDNAILRLSLITAPTEDGIVPGLAIKCLKDGHPSDNLLAQPTMAYPQSSYNLFANDYSNHPVAIAVSNRTDDENTLYQMYTQYTKFPYMVGLSKFADSLPNGQGVAKPNFPYRLIFHPTSYVHFGFPDTAPPAPLPWYQYVLYLNPGPIFDVYAQELPEDLDQVAKYLRIGQILTTRKFIPGSFGDLQLSFEHTFIERDFQFFPAWESTAATISSKQFTDVTYRYVNLPWETAQGDPVVVVDDGAPEEEETLDGAEIVLIVFLCLAFVILVVLVGVIVNGLFFSEPVSEYNAYADL